MNTEPRGQSLAGFADNFNLEEAGGAIPAVTVAAGLQGLAMAATEKPIEAWELDQLLVRFCEQHRLVWVELNPGTNVLRQL